MSTPRPVRPTVLYRRPIARPTPPARPPLPAPARRPRTRRLATRLALILLTVIIAGTGIMGYKVLSAGHKISVTDRSILGQLKDLLFNSGEFLKGEKEGRINILIIAIGGEGHRGDNLSDTIMVASIDPVQNESALLSIPRDLYVQLPDSPHFTKINALHSYGESKKDTSGPKMLTAKVEEITGLDIHYFIRTDFTAFKHIIDALGGVDVTIENSFYDYWHKISFPAGTERMNGERALAYVRARYVEGPEGGDFKRAARQQQILLAIRSKAFSPATAIDFPAILRILDSLSKNIRTDLQLWEMKRSFEIARHIDTSHINTTVLSTGPDGVLVGDTEILGGSPASVLKPRTGNYEEIKAIAANLLNTTPRESEPAPDRNETTASTTPAPPPPLDLATVPVEIRNGTTVNGLAARARNKLTESGYSIKTIGNASLTNHANTTVYATNTSRLDVAQKIAEILGAKSDSGLPPSEQQSTADILIILGADANEKI